MSAKKLSREVRLLLNIIDESYERKAWHGPNLRGSIRGLSAKEAAWRPGRGRHNIWEIVVHAAYWKYIVRRRLVGEKKGSFPLKGSNWFTRPDLLSEQAWRKDIEMLDEMHRAMRETIADISASVLQKNPATSKYTIEATVSGIGLHDVYHAGQIQLIKRLMRRG